MKFKDWARPLFVDRTMRALVLTAMVVNVLAWALIVVRLWPLIIINRTVSLHYSVYLGVNGAGPAVTALITPAAGTLVLVLNAILARFAYVRERAVSLVLLALTLFYQLLIMGASVYVVLLNLNKAY